jgi:hypothetical protein
VLDRLTCVWVQVRFGRDDERRIQPPRLVLITVIVSRWRRIMLMWFEVAMDELDVSPVFGRPVDVLGWQQCHAERPHDCKGCKRPPEEPVRHVLHIIGGWGFPVKHQFVDVCRVAAASIVKHGNRPPWEETHA